MYYYPDDLKAKPMLWLWQLRDIGIIGIILLIAVFALAQTGSLALLVCAVLFAFLTIRVENNSILDFLIYATRFLFVQQQYFEWEERYEEE